MGSRDFVESALPPWAASGSLKGKLPQLAFEWNNLAMGTLVETFANAVQLHQEGKLAQAEALYRRILDQHPDHAGALHLVGVLAHQQGQDGRAADLIARAIALNPHQATYHSNYGVALRGLGRLDEAAAAVRGEAKRGRRRNGDVEAKQGRS